MNISDENFINLIAAELAAEKARNKALYRTLAGKGVITEEEYKNEVNRDWSDEVKSSFEELTETTMADWLDAEQEENKQE